MVDFDPQGNLSCYCGIPPERDLEQTITELLMKVAYEKPLSHRECVYQSRRTDDSAPQVDFIPSNLRLASFELAMGTMMCREVLLKTCLEQYSSQYDYCIIDCSPSVGLLLTNALSAANEVIIPMQAQPFSVVGMSQLTNSISSVQRKINPGLHIRGVLLTMTQHTKSQSIMPMMSAPSMGERSVYLLRRSPITSKCRKVRRLQHPLSCTNPKAAAQEHTLNLRRRY